MVCPQSTHRALAKPPHTCQERSRGRAHRRLRAHDRAPLQDTADPSVHGTRRRTTSSAWNASHNPTAPGDDPPVVGAHRGVPAVNPPFTRRITPLASDPSARGSRRLCGRTPSAPTGLRPARSATLSRHDRPRCAVRLSPCQHRRPHHRACLGGVQRPVPHHHSPGEAAIRGTGVARSGSGPCRTARPVLVGCG